MEDHGDGTEAGAHCSGGFALRREHARGTEGESPISHTATGHISQQRVHKAKPSRSSRGGNVLAQDQSGAPLGHGRERDLSSYENRDPRNPQASPRPGRRIVLTQVVCRAPREQPRAASGTATQPSLPFNDKAEELRSGNHIVDGGSVAISWCT